MKIEAALVFHTQTLVRHRFLEKSLIEIKVLLGVGPFIRFKQHI